MAETRELQSVIAAAEQAAAVSDYASAEKLLREAATLQEASLGPLHPDLANTLNNLGVVCEITEKPLDAEHFFRRAYAIATAALPAGHPFVGTSRKNLEDFCRARGIAVDLPAPPPAVAAEPDPPAISSPGISPAGPSSEESQPASIKRSGPITIGAVIAGGLLLSLIGAAAWLRWHDRVESSPATSSPPPPREPLPADVPKETRSDPPPEPAADPKSLAVDASAAAPPVVAAVQLCSELSTGGRGGAYSEWQCVPPGAPVGPGSLYFYTRLKSASDTTVRHRWYRDDRLVHAVELPIRANTTGGYRTYSRNTVNAEGAGEWRIELRTREGALLHEERFLVR